MQTARSEISSQKWIDDHYQRPGEMPKDFSLLETELPKLQEMLEEERIIVSLRWLKQRAEELFNLARRD